MTEGCLSNRISQCVGSIDLVATIASPLMCAAQRIPTSIATHISDSKCGLTERRAGVPVSSGENNPCSKHNMVDSVVSSTLTRVVYIVSQTSGGFRRVTTQIIELDLSWVLRTTPPVQPDCRKTVMAALLSEHASKTKLPSRQTTDAVSLNSSGMVIHYHRPSEIYAIRPKCIRKKLLACSCHG